MWSTPSIDSRKTTHRTKALEAARCRAFQQGLKRHTSTKEPARTPTGPFILMFLHFHQPLLVLCITLTISKQVDYSHSRPRSKRNFGCPQARENGFQRPGFHRRNGRLHSPTKTMWERTCPRNWFYPSCIRCLSIQQLPPAASHMASQQRHIVYAFDGALHIGENHRKPPFWKCICS